jgi:hypothetical protein
MKTMMKKLFPAFIALIIPAAAHANSMPINFIPPEVFNWLFRSAGVLGVLISAALGFAGLAVATRVSLDTSSKVFARGFLGVSAVICFAVSAMFIAFSLGDMAWVSSLAVTLVFIFFTIEFIIAARLYGNVHEKNGSKGAKVLSIISYGISAVMALIAIIMFGFWFKDVPVAEVIIIVLACSLAGFMALTLVREGLPSGTKKIMGITLTGLSASILLMVAMLLLAPPGGEKGGSGGVFNFLAIGGFFLFSAQLIFAGWLFWRSPGDGQGRRRAAAIACFVIGGCACVFSLFMFLGSV